MNRRQLIAGSGDLSVPTHGITQRVIRWCYETPEPATGWAERDRIGVAFRRTPTGLDAAGREGAYFVHALVWRAGEFPAELLSALWDASVWVTAPPDEPPRQLPVLRTGAEIGVGAGPPVTREEATTTLAAHLENLAAQRRSAIALPAAQAYARAAEIARALPRRYELPAFSTFETESRSAGYDILASTAPPRMFVPIAPDGSSDPVWSGAATMLLDAADGDDIAARAIEAIGDGVSSLAAFAAALRRWAVVDTRPGAGQRLDTAALAAAASEPTLLKRLLQRSRLDDIARAIADGHRADAIFRAAREAGESRALAGAIGRVLAEVPPEAAIRTLTRLNDVASDTAAAIAAELAQAWHRDARLRGLRTTDALVLLELLARAPVDEAVNELLTSPVHVSAVLSHGRLPAEWRGRAAAASPERIAPRRLAEHLMVDAGFARGFMSGGDDASVAALRKALREAPAALAYDALVAVARFLRPETRSELAFPLLLRLDPRTRLDGLGSYAPQGGDGTEAWSDAAFDALVELVLAGRSRETPLLPALRLPFGHSRRARAWQDIFDALRGGSMDASAQAARAARIAASLERPDDVDAALEIVVDLAGERFRGRIEDRCGVLEAIVVSSRDPAPEFTARVVRAALRARRHDRQQMALVAILWIARLLEEKRLTREDAEKSPSDRLGERLRRADADYLVRVAKHANRRVARKWLKDNARAAGRNSRRS